MALITQPKHITKDELHTLARVTNDPFFFSTFVYVIHPIRGKVQFALYPFQKAVLYQFVKERFNIVLKFRQAGITELISMYCLWLCMYHPNKKVNIISIKDTTAKKVLKKIKFMYKNLPTYLQTPIINGRPTEYGSCVTGDTRLITPDGSLEIKDICPSERGSLYLDKSLKVLTHTGSFQRVIRGINKGTLETWEVVDKKGNILKCTPKHKLLTTQGWKTVKEIIKGNLNVIQSDCSDYFPEEPPTTVPPTKEIIKPCKFPGYYVSNLGRIFTSKRKVGKGKGRTYISLDNPLKELVQNNKGSHSRIKLRLGNGDIMCTGVHRLVAETFIGEISEGYIVDHINCRPKDNYVTNLQIITSSENTKRAIKYSRLRVQARKNGIQDIQVIGAIKEKYQEYGDYYGVAKRIKKEVNPPFDHKRVSQICREVAYKHVYISKLKIKRKFLAPIYDLEVEHDHSYITSSNYVNHNSSMMEFNNGSFIESVPTSPEAGRSESLTLLVIDEAAMVRWANEVWAAALPTLSTGGSAIINSTPKGIGNFYHSQWADSISGGNGFNPIRLYWNMHPERDDDWYYRMSKALGPRRTAQEIDGDFLSSGNTVFDLADIKAIEDCLSDYPIIKVRFNGQYRQFLEPDPEKKYYIGADVATGRGSDYSSFTCMDRPGEEQVVYKGRISVDKFAKLLGDTGELYNYALIAPESNDVGLAVTSMLQTEGYPNLYYYQKLIKQKGKSRPEVDKAPGWLTTNKNRSVIIEALEKDIREGNVIIKDPFFVNEAYTFIYDGLNRPVAMGKHKANTNADDIDAEVYSDDDIFGKAITNHIRKGKEQIILLPQ